jgi:hypothetical protein
MQGMNGYLTSALVGALFLVGGALMGAVVLTIAPAELSTNATPVADERASAPVAAPYVIEGAILVTAVKG